MGSGRTWEAKIRISISLILLLIPLALAAQLQPLDQWSSPDSRDHPLVGKIWRSNAGEFITVDALAKSLSSARYVLLGEKHDNADHHHLQLQVLQYLMAEVGPLTVSFEMMSESKQPLLDNIQNQGEMGRGQIKDYLEWDDEGWDWNFYGPLVERVVREGLPIRAANIDNAAVGAIYGGELPAEITAVLDQAAVDKLEQDIDESHCGMLPASQFPAMVRVQQARDAAMARSLLNLPAAGAGVLIAGNYHVRQDLGVPNYLLALQADLSRAEIVSLAILEVAEGETDPALYLEQYGDIAAFDYIWFTPSVGAIDYCAQMQAR